MEDALLNFFTFVKLNLVNPLVDAIDGSSIFESLLDFIQFFLKAFFRLWNDNNNALEGFDFTNFSNLIAEVLGLLFIVLIIKLAISIVNVFFSTIKGVLR